MRIVWNAVAIMSFGAILLFASPRSAQAALSISWTPQNPEIGDDIVFTLDGVAGTIQNATWVFGANGSDGSSTNTCVPDLWNDCTTISFAYASAGPKSVSVALELEGGGTDSVGPVWLTVAWSGGSSRGGDSCVNVLIDPGFEAGSGLAWSEYSSNGNTLITMDRPRSGSFSAWLGGANIEDSYLWQSSPIDATAISARLSYWYWIASEEIICGYDEGGVTVNGSPLEFFDFCGTYNTGGYVQSNGVDLLSYAGTTSEIRFFVTTDSSLLSSLYIDDVMLEVCVQGIPGDLVFSDGFESGDTTAWSKSVP